MDIRIAPDSHRAWAGFPYWLTRFLPLWVVFSFLGIVEGALRPVEALAGLLVLITAPALMAGAVTALWWRLRPGRISYVVRGGSLMVCRGRRVLRRFPCTEITQLDLVGALTWRKLLLRNWLTWGVDGWPRLSIDLTDWPTSRLLVGPQNQAGILLWGESRARRAEADLRRAVTLSGATLSD